MQSLDTRASAALVVGSGMRKQCICIRNVIALVVVALVLCSPCILLVLEKANVLVPGWLSSVDATYLAGGRTEVDVRSVADLHSFLRGDLQNAVEEGIENHIPMKALSLLDNAFVQRAMINASNLLFDWDCYPTYYGSDCAYIPSQDALTICATKDGDFDHEGFSAFFENVRDFALENPTIEVVVYMADPNNGTATFNPTQDLVSDSVAYSELVGCMEGFRTPDASNLRYLHGGGLKNIEEYYALHYRCDIHWNIEATVQACARICYELGEPVIAFDEFERVGDQLFCGDIARRALYQLEVPVYDLDYDFSHLDGMEMDGDAFDLGMHAQYESADALNRLYNFYGLYYDVVYETKIEGGKGWRNTLLVGDSFARSLSRPLAEASSVLYRSPALFGDMGESTELMEHVAAGEIDSVVFVGTPQNMASFTRRNPDFF